MKMMFRINKKQQKLVPIVEPQETINNNDDNVNKKQKQFNAISESFRYGMISRIPNSSNCSTCDK
jgi:hypothetical protein